MPWYAVALMLGGPAVLGIARVALFIARALGYSRDPRPGFLDLTTTTMPPKSGRKEHA